MKIKITFIFILFISINCFCQTAKDRQNIASMLNNNEAFSGNIVTTKGESDLMLVFSGPMFDSYSEIVTFIDAVTQEVWDTYYETIGFYAVCFLAGEIDKCYTKSDMTKIINANRY